MITSLPESVIIHVPGNHLRYSFLFRVKFFADYDKHSFLNFYSFVDSTVYECVFFPFFFIVSETTTSTCPIYNFVQTSTFF